VGGAEVDTDQKAGAFPGDGGPPGIGQ